MITIDDFRRLDLRIGTIVAAGDHPNADRLVLLSVDIGEEGPRQLVAGIKSAYTPESLVGRQVVVLTNLEPVNIRGVESNGMLLAAGREGVIRILTPDDGLPVGSKVS